MIKIVINACYGGFDLSERGVVRLAELDVERAGVDLALFQTRLDRIVEARDIDRFGHRRRQDDRCGRNSDDGRQNRWRRRCDENRAGRGQEKARSRDWLKVPTQPPKKHV